MRQLPPSFPAGTSLRSRLPPPPTHTQEASGSGLLLADLPRVPTSPGTLRHLDAGFPMSSFLGGTPSQLPPGFYTPGVGLLAGGDGLGEDGSDGVGATYGAGAHASLPAS